MKTLAIVLLALGTLLSGCVAVPVDDGRSYHRDRDDDGVANRHDRLPLISDRIIKAERCVVILAYHQLDLGRAAIPQPGFRSRHQRAAKPILLMLRMHREIINPTAMAIKADHRGTDNRIVP